MGKRSSQRKAVAFFDSDDDSLSSCSTALSEVTLGQETEEINDTQYILEKHVDALDEKRGSTRENALSALVDAFSSQIQLEFVDNKSATLTRLFIHSIKKGSTKETSLASRALGLLAITLGSSDDAHEIVTESMTPLAQALKTVFEPTKKSAILDCLAIITFVGGNDFDETEKSMQAIWQSIHPKLGSNVNLAKPTPAVIATAVSAWSFLLTTSHGWNANNNNWQESISFLSTLLGKDDRAVRIAAGEAIALIFEIGKFENYTESKTCTENLVSEGSGMREGFRHVEALKGKILNQVRDLSSEAGGKGSAKKDLNSQRTSFRDVLSYLETGQSPETTVKIQNGGDLLKISAWTRLIQLSFLKRFLGSGFQKHMQENELLHQVFNFTPKKKPSLSSLEKRIYQSPNSVMSKARTQHRNKQRAFSQNRNNGHFRVDEEY